MKIGFQIEHLDPARGGAEAYVHRFAQDLVAARHEVHLFAAAFGEVPDGAFSHKLLRRGLTRWQRDWRFAHTARREARRAACDVVMAVGHTFGADVLQPHGGTMRASRRQNLRLVRSPVLRRLKGLSDSVNPRIRTRLAIEALQFASPPMPEVVAISDMVRRDLIDYYHVPEDHLHLVYNGVDVERFHPDVCAARRDEVREGYGLADEETCYLLVAHNFRLKGLRELIEAAARLDASGGPWRLLVVGKGTPGPYRRLAARLGCDERLLFAGAVAEVVPAYAAADAYVHPTWYDPCSLVVLEAMACGLPIVTTPNNGASELMEDGREGYVIPSPRDAEALARAMDALRDAARREEMGQRARESAERYPLERNFREMMDVFERAVARKEEEST